jgi:hypothetical protein
MKGPGKRLPSRRVYFLAMSLAVVAWSTVARISAEAATLSDKNSTINLSLNSSAGMTDWIVDGTDAVNQQWLWFRIGNSGPQFDISTIGAPTISQLVPKTLTALYSNSLYGVSITYTLTGSSSGTGHSALTEAINFFNYQTNNSLDLHLFLYSDFSLGATSGIGNSGMNSNSALQQVFGLGRTNAVAFPLPLASHVEANTEFSTYNSLTGGSAYTLNDITNAQQSVSSGAVTWAFEWDKTLAPSTSLGTISITDTLQVPEPSVAGLAVVGSSLVFLRRRKNRK